MRSIMKLKVRVDLQEQDNQKWALNVLPKLIQLKIPQEAGEERCLFWAEILVLGLFAEFPERDFRLYQIAKLLSLSTVTTFMAIKALRYAGLIIAR